MDLVWAFSVLALLLTLCNADDEISIQPRGAEHTKAKGDSFAFTCRINVPKPSEIKNLRWMNPKNETIDENFMKVNTRYSLQLVTESTLVLVLRKLSEADVGQYTCMAQYAETKTLTAYTTLKLQVPVTFIDAPSEQLAKLGDKNFKLKCQVEANPGPTVTWNRNGLKLPVSDKYVFEPDGLVIHDVQESDDGGYLCEVLVSETGEFKSRSIHLEVISEPKIQPTLPESYNVTEGEPTRIQCSATGKPQPVISWIKTNIQKNMTSGYDGILYIDKVAKDDDGYFKCVAMNKAGTAERSVRFFVQSKPEVIEVVNNTVVEGKPGMLQCTVYGNPEPNVTIRKFGYQNQEMNILTNDVRTITEKIVDSKARYNGKAMTTVLRFTNVEKSDDGLYQCVANNRIGETIGNLHLTVEFKPTFEKSGLTPRVVTWKGKPANLTCIAQAIPNATITWYLGASKDPISRNPDRIFTIFGTGYHSILQVTPLDPRYYSPYRCKAVNAHGESVYTIQLEQAYEPSAPSDVRVVETTATTIKFQFLDSMSTGNVPLRFYVAQYIRAEEQFTNDTIKETKWPPGGPYELINLQPKTKYTIRFAAINDVGPSQWGKILNEETREISVPREPVISNQPLENEKVIKSPFAKEIELRWTIPVDNGVAIDEYAIKYCVVSDINVLDGYDDQNHDCKEEKFSSNQVISSFTIRNLTPDTTYRVWLSAHNNVGYGPRSERYFKTNATDDMPSKVGTSPGLSSAVIIYIVLAILIAFLVILDIFCFFVGKTGVIYMLCGSCCGRKKKNDDKLGSESKDLISNGHKKIDIEEQAPMIADGTKKDTAVEYDLKKGTSKTGFVGKDSAV